MRTPAFLDGAERTAWTLAEAAGSVGLLAAYQATPLPDIPAGWLPVAGVLLTCLLAGGKSWAATRWPGGNGSASLGLPKTAEPVPADRALVVTTDGPEEYVLGPAAGEYAMGKPVDVIRGDRANSVRKPGD